MPWEWGWCLLVCLRFCNKLASVLCLEYLTVTLLHIYHLLRQNNTALSSCEAGYVTINVLLYK